MKKVFPLVAYLANIAMILYLFVTLKIDIDALLSSDAEAGNDISANISIGISKVVLLIFALYGMIAVVALLIKLVHLVSRLGLFALICSLLDLVFAAIHGAVLYGLFSSTDGAGMSALFIFAVLLILSVLSFFANLKYIFRL